MDVPVVAHVLCRLSSLAVCMWDTYVLLSQYLESYAALAEVIPCVEWSLMQYIRAGQAILSHRGQLKNSTNVYVWSVELCWNLAAFHVFVERECGWQDSLFGLGKKYCPWQFVDLWFFPICGRGVVNS
jgi:hypothetical protein